MPRIAEIKEIDGEVWVRVGKPGDFPSGTALWTPDEQIHSRDVALEEAAMLADDAPEIAEAIRELKGARRLVARSHFT